MTTNTSFSHLIDRFNRKQRAVRGSRLLGDKKLAAFLVERGEWPGEYRLAPNHCVVWRPFNLRIKQSALDSWIGFGAKIQQMIDLGVSVTDDEQGSLFARYGGITVEIDSPNPLSTFREIIVDQAYRVTLPDNCVVLDIGANDGFASLYFAADQRVSTVYAYEPLAPTLRQLCRNAALNPASAHKIKTRQYGVAAASGSATIRYTPATRASLSLFWDPVPENSPDATEEPITLRPATEILAEIRRDHPGQPIVIKLDCEGAEREIIASLVETGSLQDVPILTGETHDLSRINHSEIVAPLERAGYTVFSHRSTNPDLGLFHACRSAF